MKRISSIWLLPLLAQFSSATTHSKVMAMRRTPLGMMNMHLSEGHQADLDNDDIITMGMGTFDQLLDHSDPDKGTFKQRYWWNAEFFEEDGPVFLFNGGENSADNFIGYLENTTLPGHYAQQFKGAVIVIEHRYWGKSIPFDTLTAETLQYLNLPNAINDMTYFAKNVDCKFCEGTTCNSNENPWVLIGGSYSGALSAWTSQLDPGTFTAYHASSAVVEAIYDFWEYFTPIEEALPRNCSADIKTVIQYVDDVLEADDESDVAMLKSRFGLSTLNNADFAYVLATPIFQWQIDRSKVLSFCDHIESVSSNYTHWMSKSGRGVGLVAALDAYSSYIKQNANCGKDGALCNTYNSTRQWNDPTDLTSDARQWQWMLCNEPFGWYQVGPPKPDGTNIVSTFLRPEFFQRRCPLAFPETNGFRPGSVEGFTAEHLDMWTKGWGANYERVVFVNGEHDPWRSATIAADNRPGGPVQSSDQIPSFVVKGGVHVPDFVLDGSADQNRVLGEAVVVMGRWLAEWKGPSRSRRTVARR